MGTHPIEMELASGRGRLSLANTVERRAGISVRLATGIRRVIPGSRTDSLGKGSIGRVSDLLWPIFWCSSPLPGLMYLAGSSMRYEKGGADRERLFLKVLKMKRWATQISVRNK